MALQWTLVVNTASILYYKCGAGMYESMLMATTLIMKLQVAPDASMFGKDPSTDLPFVEWAQSQRNVAADEGGVLAAWRNAYHDHITELLHDLVRAKRAQ